MKYLLILVAFAAMALVSCNDSTTSTPAQPTVLGTWKATTPITYKIGGTMPVSANLSIVLNLWYDPSSKNVTGTSTWDVFGSGNSLENGTLTDLTGTFVNPDVNLTASGYTFPGTLAGDGKSIKMKPTGFDFLPAGTEMTFNKQ